MRDPALLGTRVVILTTFDLDEHIFEALRVGASGFLVKDTEPRAAGGHRLRDRARGPRMEQRLRVGMELQLALDWSGPHEMFGYTFADPVALMTNPAAAMAFGHIVTSSLVLGALVVGAVSAYHLLRRKDPHGVFGRGIRYTAITVALTSELVAIFGGIQFGYFEENPPTSGLTYTAGEIEAIEAASEGALVQAANTTGETLMFGMYALIALIGPTMLLGWLVSRWVKAVRRQRWLLAPLIITPFLPYLASIGGWVFRETNRRPWAVLHHLTTADAVTPMSPGVAVVSFGFFTFAFAALAVITYWLLVRYARLGPEGGPLAERPEEHSEPSAPVHTF